MDDAIAEGVHQVPDREAVKRIPETLSPEGSRHDGQNLEKPGICPSCHG